jgi:YggT family protein
MRFVVDILQLYIVILLVRIIFTWFPISPWSSMGKVVQFFARLTDPILVPLRRIIPPLRVGGAAIDLSPLILFFALEIVISRLH